MKVEGILEAKGRHVEVTSPSAELQLAPTGGSPPRELVLQISVATCLFVTVASFFAVQPIIDLAKHAARTLPF